MNNDKDSKIEGNNSKQYLDDLKEWQEHQYNPAYWTGDKTPPFIKYGGKKLGVVYLIMGVLILAFGVFSFFDGGSDKVISLIVYLLFGILIILAGLKKIKNH